MVSSLAKPHSGQVRRESSMTAFNVCLTGASSRDRPPGFVKGQAVMDPGGRWRTWVRRLPQACVCARACHFDQREKTMPAPLSTRFLTPFECVPCLRRRLTAQAIKRPFYRATAVAFQPVCFSGNQWPVFHGHPCVRPNLSSDGQFVQCQHSMPRSQCLHNGQSLGP